MISGIGVDIVQIKRFKRIMKRYGDRMEKRLLTHKESEQFHKRGGSISFIASRFAAKEAASKALGTGIAKGVGFHSIEVVSSELGKPELKFHGVAKEILLEKKITSASISISDERKYVVAMVVLESGS